MQAFIMMSGNITLKQSSGLTVLLICLVMSGLVLCSTLYLFLKPGKENNPDAGLVIINEVMASNGRTITDGDGDYEDWIELYNPGDEDIDLKGYYLSDDPGNIRRWRFPGGLIRAGGHLLVWASGKNKKGMDGELHTNFRINRKGEPIILVKPDGETIVDFMPDVPIPRDMSYGRSLDSLEWKYFREPTPDMANTTQGFSRILEPPVFSRTGGFFDEYLSLDIIHPDQKVDIFFTIDGSIPDPSQKIDTFQVMQSYPDGTILTWKTRTHVYDSTLNFDYSDIPDNNIQYINTTFLNDMIVPDEGQLKSLVFRAVAYDQVEGQTSDVTSKTFFVHSGDFTGFSLPVVSIISEPKGLFDHYEGIYVAGDIFNTYRINNPHDSLSTQAPANYNQRGREWERPAFFEFFEEHSEDPVLAQDIGIRIHGHSSRALPNKSLRLYARSHNGPGRFNHEIFPGLTQKSDSGKSVHSFNRLILRNSGQDGTDLDGDSVNHTDTLMRDALGQMVLKPLAGVDYQDYRPAVMFLNGAYWGIFNIRERIDQHYFESHYDLAAEDVVIIANEEVHYGNDKDIQAYLDLEACLGEGTSNDRNLFDCINELLDIESFSNYNIGNLFLTHSYWPCGGTGDIRSWRKRTEPDAGEQRTGHDGRWRWMWKDMDKSFTDYELDMYEQLENSTCIHAALTSALWNHQDYRIYFLNSLADKLNTSLRKERLRLIIDEIQKKIAQEKIRHFSRWKSGRGKPDQFFKFAEKRQDAFLRQTLEYFALSGTALLTLDVSDPGHGYVRINSVEIGGENYEQPEDSYPWSGIYFRDVPVELEAIPRPGYIFSRWEGLPQDAPPVTKHIFSEEEASIDAVFERAP